MSENEANLAVQEVPATNMMQLLQIALSNKAGIDVIERLAALQRDEQARLAQIEFNEALNRVQEKIKRIAPDATNNHTKSKWATYAAIDRVIRPIYAAEGFSLSFTHADCPIPEYVRVVCRVALRSHTSLYQVDWPVSGKGAKGGDVVSSVQAMGISDSYAKRYLVKDIFNIAIGEDDTDGSLTMGAAGDYVANIQAASNQDELQKAYTEAIKSAVREKDWNACKLFQEAREKRGKELGA